MNSIIERDRLARVAPKLDPWNTALTASIIAALSLLLYLSVSGRVFVPLLREIKSQYWLDTFARPSMLWATMGTLLLGFRTALWFRYRPCPAADMEDAPALTVIIPAYNEGAMVQMTIDSVAAARYPRERLEILVIDDGSTDDTWGYIERAARRHGALVTAVRFDANQGKRRALETGFRRAQGEVVVTVDSDSVIEPGTLLAMAGPFRQATVGAVAGRVAVYNRREGLIPRMLAVRYVLAFDFLRAVQSVYRTVYCCPGALAAYRTSAVRDTLDAWSGQRFLGVACTYGEDRSLTNFILSRGYDTLYQRSAVVHTLVPRTYAKLCKMYLRWDRSYVREELRLACILWGRPALPRLITLIDIVITNLRYPVGLIVLGLLIVLTVHSPLTLLRVLAAIGLVSAFNMCYYLRCERSWDAVFGLLYSYFAAFTLFWIFPYAALTLRARSWMTR